VTTLTSLVVILLRFTRITKSAQEPTIRLLRTFGERRAMAQPVTRRFIISPLIKKDFRMRCPLLAGGNFASASLNHQKCARAHNH
jgi:hypothetical protein